MRRARQCVVVGLEELGVGQRARELEAPCMSELDEFLALHLSWWVGHS